MQIYTLETKYGKIASVLSVWQSKVEIQSCYCTDIDAD